MDLSEINAFAAAQNDGSWHELMHPVDGKPIGITLKVVGPDSDIARQASLSLQAEVAKLQGKGGRVDPAKAEDMVLDHMARLVIDWQATENGRPISFTHDGMVRLLRAGQWIKNQLAGFTATRAPFVAAEVLH